VRAPLIAASILVVIALVGNWLLRQLGIGIPAFQIAGGLLLFGVSYQMILGDRPHREAREATRRHRSTPPTSRCFRSPFR
jgi:multiple antibiotic resistance protein